MYLDIRNRHLDFYSRVAASLPGKSTVLRNILYILQFLVPSHPIFDKFHLASAFSAATCPHYILPSCSSTLFLINKNFQQMENIPENDAQNFCSNCKGLQKDTCGPSNTLKELIQKDESIKRLPEHTHPISPSLGAITPILFRSSSTAQKGDEPVTSDEPQDNTIKCQLITLPLLVGGKLHYSLLTVASTAFKGYNHDTSLATLETGVASADGSRFRRISPEVRRFLLVIIMVIMAIPFSFAVQAWGNLDRNQTIGILQVSAIFFVELAKLFPWI
ncbi:hypothetical protein DFP73DRAFT_301868 [Morchella snyderi]|nr:hypothetical protein DFP73DRAFT_301868 [Morchella snyderi]